MNFWRRLVQRRETAPAYSGQVAISCGVTGVYATAHTTAGDFDSGLPEDVTIDCEMITFELPIYDMPVNGTAFASTLHFGLATATCPIKPPAKFYKGYELTVIQPVSMVKMAAEHPIMEEMNG